MNKIVLPAVLLIGSLLVGSGLGWYAFAAFSTHEYPSVQHDFTFDAYTSVDVKRVDGTIEHVQNGDHNFFSNAGKDAVLDVLAGRLAVGTTAVLSNFTVIAVGNDTNAAGLVQAYIDSGLTNATGTVTRITNGNWSIVQTFTASASNKDVNATALFNGTSTGSTYFAGNNFTKVTLATNDQLQITWNVSVS